MLGLDCLDFCVVFTDEESQAVVYLHKFLVIRIRYISDWTFLSPRTIEILRQAISNHRPIISGINLCHYRLIARI